MMTTNTGGWVSCLSTLTSPNCSAQCLQMCARHGCSPPSKAQCSLVICVLEMHTGLCGPGLLTLGQELRGRRVYCFCDNTAAWSSMITVKYQDNGSRERALPPLRNRPQHRFVGGVGQLGHKHCRPAQLGAANSQR